MHIYSASSSARWAMETGEFPEAGGAGILVGIVVNKRPCLKKSQGGK